MQATRIDDESLAFWSALIKDRRMAPALGLGFTSGMPFLLTYSTQSAWLTDAGVPLATIGLLSELTLAYKFKFVMLHRYLTLTSIPCRSESVRACRHARRPSSTPLSPIPKGCSRQSAREQSYADRRRKRRSLVDGSVEPIVLFVRLRDRGHGEAPSTTPSTPRPSSVCATITCVGLAVAQ